MSALPRSRSPAAPAMLSAGFRPFFLLAALWAAAAVPLWLAIYGGQARLASVLPAAVWHGHEMVFGYGAAVVAGFLLTAIPGWTGRAPFRGSPLAALAGLWALGRAAELFSARIGADAAAALDLTFPAVFLAVAARDIIGARNWRNSPVSGALALLLAGNLLVHLEALGVAVTAELGNRIGVATLVMLIAFVGGRIVPLFTRNWLARERPEIAAPASFGAIDRTALGLTALALAGWVAAPQTAAASWAAIAAGLATALRLARWRGPAAWREPLVWSLHLGYLWLAAGLVLLGLAGLAPQLPPSAALHALTVGAIGTMTLAVMTRATLGHTGRPLTAGPATTAIYLMVTLAAVLRLCAPLDGDQYLLLLSLAGAAWCGAFGLFVLVYAGPLVSPRRTG